MLPHMQWRQGTSRFIFAPQRGPRTLDVHWSCGQSSGSLECFADSRWPEAGLWELLKLLDNLQRVQKSFLEHFQANPVGQGSNSFVFNDPIDFTISDVFASRSKQNLVNFAKLDSIGFQSEINLFVKGMS